MNLRSLRRHSPDALHAPPARRKVKQKLSPNESSWQAPDVSSEVSPRRRPGLNAWRRSFIARITAMSFTFQLPAMIACMLWLMRDHHLPAFAAALVSLGLHAAGFSIFVHRLVWWIDDVKMPWWRAWLLDVPYAAYGTGLFVSAIPSVLTMIAWGIATAVGAHPGELLQWLAWPIGIGVVLGVYGSTVGRLWARVRTTEVTIAGLPKGLDGFTLVQLSDVHCGPHLPRWTLRRWMDKANALGGDVVVLTGDLITTGEGYLDDVEAFAKQLKAPLGVHACMGNHDYFETTTGVVEALGRAGVKLYRNAGAVVEKGGEKLFIAGIDDHWSKRDDLDAALRDAPAGVVRVLLCHDPRPWKKDVAPRGVELTLSGHTHAGQIALPWPLTRLNLYRLVDKHADGLYREGGSQLFVHRGIGITGVPTRIFAWPEIARVVLRAA